MIVRYRISILTVFVIGILVLFSPSPLAAAKSTSPAGIIATVGMASLPNLLNAQPANYPVPKVTLNTSEAGYGDYQPDNSLQSGHIYGGATSFIVPVAL